MVKSAFPAGTFLLGLLLGGTDLFSAGPPPSGAPSETEVRAPLVEGIGGVFFKAEDPGALRGWYQEHLGLEGGPEGTQFLWRDVADSDRVGRTVWSVFPAGTEYFGGPDQQLMVNYIVTDLDALLERLATQGVRPVKPTEAYDFGRFAWIEDGEGNRIELWEPTS